jgi:predicted oxidoreductase (fatty acid repression mutant protein)
MTASALPTANGTATTKPTAGPLSADAFLALIKNRRTFYPLNKDLTITPARIQELVAEALQHVPSSFNSQSNRVVVLFGAEHDKFWDITRDILKAIVPAEAWEATGGKMAMFKAGAGTVLFFEDQTVVEGMQERFAAYADRYVLSLLHSRLR